MKTFYNLLANNLVASIINSAVWFGLIFYIYLQTQSVFATSIMSGIYLITVSATGFWFGSLVDHNDKKRMMILSSAISLVFYSICFAIYQLAGTDTFKDIQNPLLWIFVVSALFGVIVGNIRNIALPTMVALLVPEERRDKANGMVGTVSGISFLVVSVISGYLVGFDGMFTILILALTLTFLPILHLLFLSTPNEHIESHAHEDIASKRIDLKGTFAVIKTIPGLTALILFTTCNNFLGGVFMSLMDPYGLSFVSVETWGLIWGFLSTAFIIGGLVISKWGLGKNPLRSMFLANLFIWVVCSIFTVYPSIILLCVGMFLYLCVVPFIEASEQTIMQRVVPAERLGRVFGFAQSVEQAASPLTAFIIGPIAQFIFIPFMTTGKGVELIGSWFGTGANRGIALIFTIAGLLGLILTLFGMRSKYYKMLSERYKQSKDNPKAEAIMQEQSLAA